jgi:hypothetical protein
MMVSGTKEKVCIAYQKHSFKPHKQTSEIF